MLQYEKIKDYKLDQWVMEFNEIYRPINQARYPSGIWLYVVEHTAAIHEALRLARYTDVRNQIPRVFCWLCAFVTSAHQSEVLGTRSSLTEIILSKYPTLCFYCQKEKCLCQSSFGAEIENVDDKEIKKWERRAAAQEKRAKLGANAPQTLPQFTDMFRAIFGHKNFDAPIEILAAHFQEEIGEVSHDINQIYDQTQLGNYDDNRIVTRDDLEEEIADVFTWLVALYWKTDYILGGAKKYFYETELSEKQLMAFPSLGESFEELVWKAFVDKETGTYLVDPRTQKRPVPAPIAQHPEKA